MRGIVHCVAVSKNDSVVGAAVDDQHDRIGLKALAVVVNVVVIILHIVGVDPVVGGMDDDLPACLSTDFFHYAFKGRGVVGKKSGVVAQSVVLSFRRKHRQRERQKHDEHCRKRQDPFGSLFYHKNSRPPNIAITNTRTAMIANNAHTLPLATGSPP